MASVISGFLPKAARLPNRQERTPILRRMLVYRDIKANKKSGYAALFVDYLDLRRTSNTKAQTRCTDATLIRSLGV